MGDNARLSAPLRKLRAQVCGQLRMVAKAGPEALADATHAIDDFFYATQRFFDGQERHHAEQASPGEAGQ